MHKLTLGLGILMQQPGPALDGAAESMEKLSEIPKKRDESIHCVYINARFDAIKLLSASENVPCKSLYNSLPRKPKLLLSDCGCPDQAILAANGLASTADCEGIQILKHTCQERIST